MAKKKRKILERLDALERLARRSIQGGDRGRSGRGPRRDHDDRDECGDHRGHCEFDEKRVIDTVTRLVTERVGRVIQKEAQKRDGGGDRREERRDDRGGDGWRNEGRRERRDDDRRDDDHRDHDGGDRDRRGHDDRRDDGGGRNGGGEKRMVDLLVGLISEHVREIVATELDSRMGPPRNDSEDVVVEKPRPAARKPRRKPAESE